jgi:hypothetical protein
MLPTLIHYFFLHGNAIQLKVFKYRSTPAPERVKGPSEGVVSVEKNPGLSIAVSADGSWGVGKDVGVGGLLCDIGASFYAT